MHRYRLGQFLMALILLPLAPLPCWTSTSAASEAPPAEAAAGQAKHLLERIGTNVGICAVVGDATGQLAVGLAKGSELLVYVQVRDNQAVTAVSRLAESAGLLGRRIWVAKGTDSRLHLADNLADAVVVTGATLKDASRDDLMRSLAPGGKLLLGDEQITKPFPAGIDEWTHPYHLPDNNPLSCDQVARFPYLTQFLAEPWYGPMLQMTVASGGRLFKAFGHLAVKQREQPWLCTLVAMNGYNGTILWKRPLSPGFMIHRNTLVATPTAVYLGDETSCKILDAATGQLRGEIFAPAEQASDAANGTPAASGPQADGPVWKWMAVDDGVLYALVGEKEFIEPVQRRDDRLHGWRWDARHIGAGYYKRPYPWGFGHTLLAIDLATKKVLWSRKEDKPLDGRAICMKNGRIYAFSSQAFLSCRSAKDGQELWRCTQQELLDAIGPDQKATMFDTGWSSTAYMKCTDKAIYFAGPQRARLVAASTQDGKLLWAYDRTGNFQLVLRPEALYAMGSQTDTSRKFDPLTGRLLADLGMKRRACTRATGNTDSIFIRGFDGTGRFDLAAQKPSQIKPMRPACTDGVVVAHGLLYWGPWLCDCNLSLVGTICLGPAGEFKFDAQAKQEERLESQPVRQGGPAPLPQSPADWPTYRADNLRSSGSPATVPEKTKLAWTFTPPAPAKATAPAACGGLIFLSGADGAVRALDAASGSVKWTAFTGGPVLYPPSIAEGRCFVGSGDGWVYCFEAATGSLRWRFRAAPAERRIPVYGSLCSTWPVASGVLVDRGVAYAACGIANYDGTHVYALDAATGKIRWQNNTSGCLDAQQNTGVSVQGHLLLHRDRPEAPGGDSSPPRDLLYLAGGNLVSPAAYDIRDGRFVATKLQRGWRGKELFFSDGQVRGSGHILYAPEDDYKDSARTCFEAFSAEVVCALVRQGGARQAPQNLVARCRTAPASLPEAGKPQPADPLWQKPVDANFLQAMAVAGNSVVLAFSQPRPAPGAADASRLPGTGGQAGEGGEHGGVIEALDLRSGQSLWRHPLPAEPVDCGLAIDRDGRVLVALRDGRVLCFGPQK